MFFSRAEAQRRGERHFGGTLCFLRNDESGPEDDNGYRHGCPGLSICSLCPGIYWESVVSLCLAAKSRPSMSVMGFRGDSWKPWQR